jgi:glycosyltransferase involved in cell wall biosynthesis
MRVGFDARWYNGSGVGTYITGLLQALAEFTDDFELVIYEEPENPVPVPSRARFSRVPVSSSRFSLAGQLELRALCKQAQIDVFHCPYQYAVPLVLSCPLVITIHDLIPLLFRTRAWHKQLVATPLVSLGYRAAAARAHHIITDSANTSLDLKRILGVSANRITAVHLAASEAGFHPMKGAGEMETLAAKYGIRAPYVVVSSAGCNWRTKNLGTALRALAIGRQMSGVDFQTVVHGPEEGLNVASGRNSTSELNIRRVGYLTVSDLGALFRNANLFLTASLYEGFGLPVLEAMSCGCPVVTSNGGSLAEVAADGAQVFDPMDAQGMAEAVARLLCQAGERERWHARALARASAFSWRKTAAETLTVYQNVYG